MGREILVHIAPGETQGAVIQDGRLDDFHIEVEHHQSILGNIYKGKVESILPSINGAFVNIGQEKNGFLYLTDAVYPGLEEELPSPQKFFKKIFNRGDKKENAVNMKTLPLKEGQEILVQVVKDPFSTKGARLTTHISLAGRFIVYMPYDKHTGVSKKIEDQEERQRLKGLLKDLDFVKTGGFIIRTASHEKGVPELIRDAKFLYKIWQQIVKLAEQKQAPALIYKEYDLIWKIVRDYFSEHVEKLIIDSEEECLKVKKFVANLIGKEEVEKVHFYNDPTPLFESKGVSEELQKIYDTKVYLKSGAYVDRTDRRAHGCGRQQRQVQTRATPEDAALWSIRKPLRDRPPIAPAGWGIIVIDLST